MNEETKPEFETSTLTESEKNIWAHGRNLKKESISDEEINIKYAKRELRIITETNREQLPNFVAALKRPGWLSLQPFYQRRKRWDDERKSKLIESFIMNVPVPPFFLYESDLAKYEVMDGQQRISAIQEFYDNGFRLKGLEQWPELNGRSYTKLPSEIKAGLDRRSVSYIVLLKESATSSEDEMLLRQQVFERLNTGGVELENQEIRHCIYHTPFDDLLMELARRPEIRRAWSLPLYSKEEEENPPPELLENQFFGKMKDAELVLRFFALRNANHYRGGMHQFLDSYMAKSRHFSHSDIQHLKYIFCRSIQTASEIYQDLLFKPWIIKEQKWASSPQVAFADAVLYGISECLISADLLVSRRDEIIAATKHLINESQPGLFSGQGNTRSSTIERLNAYKKMLNSILEKWY